jgi:hypothetical protein
MSELSSDLQKCDVDLNRASTKTQKHCLNIARIKGTSWKRFQASTVVQLSPLFFWDVTRCRLVAVYWHCPNSISLSKTCHLRKPSKFFWQSLLYNMFMSGLHTIFKNRMWAVPISRKVHIMLRSKISIIHHIIQSIMKEMVQFKVASNKHVHAHTHT